MNNDVRVRVNMYYNEIVEQMDKIRSISTDLAMADKVDWGHVGSLAHISGELDDIIGGFEGE
jgi:hypothetical protein